VATEGAAPDAAGNPAHAGIVVTDLAVRYQGTPEPAIAGLSLDVAPGHGLCVTGGEGSGKTTLVRALVGLVAPVRGAVRIGGANPLEAAVRRGVGYGPERMPFPRGLRVVDAVRLVAAVRGTDQPPGVALERAGLPPDDRRLITRLELGDVRRASLACAIVGDPHVVVLDDPWEFPETVDVIRTALASGRAVVVATPDPGGFPDLLGARLDLAAGVPE
jgi:ABC-type multidrug transport system ATPase subunit